MLHMIFTVNNVINDTLGWVYCVYTFVFMRKNDFATRLRTLCIELKYIFVISQVIDVCDELAFSDRSPLSKVIYLAVNIWFTWYCLRVLRDDDDDRWKRRRKKAAETVKAIGGKLVVVPVLTPQPIGAR